MITVKIKTNLIDKNRLYRGKKHNYLDLVLIENKNGRDEFGYDGFVKQGFSKEERDANPDLQMPIIGNFTIFTPRAADTRTPIAAPITRATSPEIAEDDIPF